MKNFFIDHEHTTIIRDWNQEYQDEIIKTWNQEIPKYVENFNTYEEDRNAVIYFALFVEYHVNKCLEILFPDFDSLLGISKTAISTKINILAAFKLFPIQIFEALRCINNIRNEFAHDIEITKLDDIQLLNEKRKKGTTLKLVSLTNEYEGDYNYEKINDTLKNRFKSLCLNTITAFRIYEPLVKDLRKNLENNF